MIMNIIDNSFLIGLGVGAIGTAALIPPHHQSKPKPRTTMITRALTPIRFGNAIKKCGAEFVILGHKFYGLFDTGSIIEPRFMMDKQTAQMVGIHNFHKSSRTTTVHFIESGIQHLPIYEDVPLEIPGISTIVTDVIIGGNNLVNPAIFLRNHDISFHSNFITFLPKNNLLHGGVFVPYTRGTETAFNFEVGHHILPMLLDTGDETSMVNAKRLFYRDISKCHLF